MRLSKQITLYSLAAPLALLPLMEFSFSEIGDFLRGNEVRTALAEIVIQLLSGLAGTIITVLSQLFFGVLS